MSVTSVLLYSMVLSAASWIPAPAPASPQVRGLDTPRAYLQRSMGPSPTSPGNQRVRACLVYRSFAVLWTSDPGLIGTPDLEVRQVGGEASPADACADGFTGKRTLNQKSSDTVPVGAVDKYLVLVYPDGAGVLTSLHVADMSAGRPVRSVTFNWGKGVDFSHVPPGVTATYWRALTNLACVPSPASGACWQEIKSTHGAPLAGVPAPDCGPAIKGRREREKSAPTAASLQITIKVSEVLGREDFEVFPVMPTCDFAP
jgi:hypothetical protein